MGQGRSQGRRDRTVVAGAHASKALLTLYIEQCTARVHAVDCWLNREQLTAAKRKTTPRVKGLSYSMRLRRY
jgi:hypothetical protein